VRLSAVGSAIFYRLIYLCQTASEPLRDELNYAISRAPWEEIDVPIWTHRFVELLLRRPRDRAFACLEALMMKKATARREVQLQYDALLTAFAERERRPAAIGIDGFPLDRDSALAKQHQRIDQLLRMTATGVEQYRETKRKEAPSCLVVASEVHSTLVIMADSIVDEFGGDAPSLHHAATVRYDWIRDHRTQFESDILEGWRQAMFELDCGGGLVQRALRRVESLSLESVIDGLRVGGGQKAFELVQKYIASNGWNPALVEAVRQWIPSIGSAASDQVYRARAEWFLWWEDVCPIDPTECWSHHIKQDLRGMPPEERANWRALLDHNSFQYTGKPPENWREGADTVLATLGPDRFSDRFLAWFEPFAKGEPQRITITGRNIARTMMWFALAAKDPAVDNALIGFANARWKNKESAARAVLAEMSFAFVLAERTPENAIPILEMQVVSGHAFEGSKTHLVYKDLCARWNRAPVSAIPEPKGSPSRSPGGNDIRVKHHQQADHARQEDAVLQRETE
jgi:hypothetical protein